MNTIANTPRGAALLGELVSHVCETVYREVLATLNRGGKPAKTRQRQEIPRALRISCERQVLAALRRGEASRAEILAAAPGMRSLSYTQAHSLLQGLQAQGLIHTRGRTRGAKWRLSAR